MRHTINLLALAFAAPAIAAQSEQVTVRDLGNGRYQLSITLAETADPNRGQAALVPKAVELCGSLRPQFGRYRFEGNEPLAGTANPGKASLQYTQDIECKDPSTTVAAESAVPPAPATPPTAEDEADIRRWTLAYLEAKDKGDFDRGHAVLGPTLAGYSTPETWKLRAAFNAGAGGDPSREVIRVTWYDDPQGAPTPGRYVAADYRASYASNAFYCGYVVWLRQHDGSYLITREEEGQAMPEVVAGVAPESMPAMRAQLGCWTDLRLGGAQCARSTTFLQSSSFWSKMR